MIACVRTAPGVRFTVIAPGGMKMIEALVWTAEQISHDLTITSACDGNHSGIDDPHHRGEALDIRTHDLPDKHAALARLREKLGDRFYFFIEDEGTPNEHIHGQVKKGTVYPPLAASTLEAT